MPPDPFPTSYPSLGQLLRDAELPSWLREMKARYALTGTYSPEDLHRLLGDPNKRVEVRSTVSVTSFLAGSQPD